MSAVLATPPEAVVPSAATATGVTGLAAPTASDRLALSRERLRLAMRETRDTSRPSRHASDRQPASKLDWLDPLRAIPGASVVIEAVSSWWAQHPLRVTTLLAANAAKAVVHPMAQRHPLGLVLGALLLGGLIAWSRPWRWILKPALFAGLVPQLISKTLAHMPVQSWMAVLTSLAQAQGRRSPQESAAPAEPSPQEQFNPPHSPAV